MNLIQSFILGAVQGLTEFIPVSSSGHMVLLQRLFGITDSSLTFTVFVHFGTLVAVLVVFWKDIVEIMRKPFSKLPLLILTSAAVTGIIGILFSDFFRSIFSTGQAVGISFLFTGLVIFYVDSHRKGKKTILKMGYLDAVLVGLMQAVSILPAVSRSGMTISGSLLRGLDRQEAARYSFLLSIPVILGANILEINNIFSNGTEMSVNILPIVIGTVSAAVAGYFAIHYMLRVLTQGSLKKFSYYVFVLGILVLLDQFLFNRFFPPLL